MKRLLTLFTLVALLLPSFAFAEESQPSISIDSSLQKNKNFKETGRSGKIKIKGDSKKILTEKPTKHLNKQKLKTFKENSSQKLLKNLDSKSTSNTDHNNPKIVEINGIYDDYITEEKQVKWYAFEALSAGKLTVFLETIKSANIDYDLFLFKLNEDTMSLEEVGYSNYPSGFDEQVATISEGGLYFFAIKSNKGFSIENPFYFTIKHSKDYDTNEVDDNSWLATSYLNKVNHSGTIDNLFDTDWIKLSLDEAKTLNSKLTNNAASINQLHIYDSNLNYLGGLEENTDYKVTFSPGIYYLQVSSVQSFDDLNKYEIKLEEDKKTAAKSTITMINSDGGVEGRVDYGWGRAWRIKNNITINGTAFDNNNKALPNAHIEFTIKGRLNNKIYTAETVTDSNGNYKVPMSIGHAIGNYSYSAPVSTHYFDVIPIIASSNGQLIELSDSILYHFAYSMR